MAAIPSWASEVIDPKTVIWRRLSARSEVSHLVNLAFFSSEGVIDGIDVLNTLFADE